MKILICTTCQEFIIPKNIRSVYTYLCTGDDYISERPVALEYQEWSARARVDPLLIEIVETFKNKDMHYSEDLSLQFLPEGTEYIIQIDHERGEEFILIREDHIWNIAT